MPSNIDDDEIKLKFDDCLGCRFRKKPRTCRECDAGEFFEEDDPVGIDAPLRFN